MPGAPPRPACGLAGTRSWQRPARCARAHSAITWQRSTPRRRPRDTLPTSTCRWRPDGRRWDNNAPVARWRRLLDRRILMFIGPGSPGWLGRMLTRDAAERVARNWWVLLVNGLLLIVAGVLIFSIDWSVRSLSIFIGALFILQGISTAFARGLDRSAEAINAVAAVLSMAAGVAIITWPLASSRARRGCRLPRRVAHHDGDDHHHRRVRRPRRHPGLVAVADPRPARDPARRARAGRPRGDADRSDLRR